MTTEASLFGAVHFADKAGRSPRMPQLVNRGHAALPARPLGPKASLLMARRRSQAASPLSRVGDIRFATQDGTLSILMRRQGNRLFVERLQLRPLDTQLVQCLLFDSIANLQRWAETDPLRFEDPALHQRMYRRGEQILNEQG